MPLEFQIPPGAPYLASKPTDEPSDPKLEFDDDLDRPSVRGPGGTEGRDLVIYHFLLFQAPQKRIVDGDEG